MYPFAEFSALIQESDRHRARENDAMASGQLGEFLRQIRHWAGVQEAGALSDRALLERFTRERDEVAFTVLVRRYGPLILAACRRVLHHTQDAEDAFQATFLVLARKSASICRRESVAGWLYRVAYHIAVRARAAQTRRRELERQVGRMRPTEPPHDLARQELYAVLDEELQRLPDAYRAPLVLCYLDGKSHAQAARQLDWPIGTVKGRLARARQLLKTRLLRRGVSLSAGTMATFLAQNAADAAVPVSLLTTTVKAATLPAIDQMVAAGAISAQVASLVEGAMKAMFLSKLKIATAFLLAMTVTIAGAGLIAHRVLSASQAEDQQAEKPKQAQEALPFQRTPLSADDLAAVTGLNVYKFRLEMPKGERFTVMVREFPAKDAEAKVLQSQNLEKTRDGPMILRVSFLRLDRKLDGVLLKQEERAEYGVECEACDPSGFFTVIQNPLFQVPGTEKILWVIASNKADFTATKPGETRLIHITRTEKTAKGQYPGYPRAELVIIRPPITP